MATGIVAATAATIARPTSYRSQAEDSSPESWGDWHSWEILDGGTYRDMTPRDPLPSCGVIVVVRSPDVIVVTDSRSVTSVTIDAGGRLDIDGTATTRAALTFCDDDGDPSLVINQSNGTRLVDAYADLRFEADTAITGSGTLLGMHSDAAIILVTSSWKDVHLQTNVVVRGALVIKATGSGDGTFVNSKQVIADWPDQVLALDSSLAGVSDASGTCCVPRWQVSDEDAVLRFNRAATALHGDFSVGPGRLDVNKPVCTGGLLLIKHGGVITPNLLALACFSFADHCPGPCASHCTWIPVTVCVPVRCH